MSSGAHKKPLKHTFKHLYSVKLWSKANFHVLSISHWDVFVFICWVHSSTVSMVIIHFLNVSVFVASLLIMLSFSPKSPHYVQNQVMAVGGISASIYCRCVRTCLKGSSTQSALQPSKQDITKACIAISKPDISRKRCSWHAGLTFQPPPELGRPCWGRNPSVYSSCKPEFSGVV